MQFNKKDHKTWNKDGIQSRQRDHLKNKKFDCNDSDNSNYC